jgi:glucosamine kinase
MNGACDPVVIGLDGGGSKTLLAVANRAGSVLTLQRDAGSNPFDAPDWRDVLMRLGARAAEIAPRVIHAAFALPGYGEVERITAAQDAAIAALGFTSWSVLNDVEAAFEAAFAGNPGILLLAGTGSMLWARSAAGRDHRVGGWGEAFGDEGSAFWIGREMVARVSRDIDGRVAAPGLATALFHHLGLDAARPQDALSGWYHGHAHRRSAVAALAPLVDALATAGNEAARTILDEAAGHLALHVEAAWRAFRDEPPDGDALPWSYAGGAFRSVPLRTGVTRLLRVPPVEPRLPPLGGALLRAARRAGWTTDEAWIQNLNARLNEATFQGSEQANRRIT